MNASGTRPDVRHDTCGHMAIWPECRSPMSERQLRLKNPSQVEDSELAPMAQSVEGLNRRSAGEGQWKFIMARA